MRKLGHVAMAAVFVLMGCTQDLPPTESSDPPKPPAATGPLAGSLIVSDPRAAVAYVSLPPGTLHSLATIRIVNRRTAEAVTPAVVAGGFDPISIPAVVGDTLDVAVTEDAVTTHTLVEALKVRPPRVVRTRPPKGQTDVPLNAVIEIVLSEPIDPATATPNSIRLLLGGQPVPGSLELDPIGTALRFTPAAPLLPVSTYVLEITTTVADRSGTPLDAPTTVSFTTAALELVFTSQPMNTEVGMPMSTDVQVTARNQLGETVVSFDGPVTLTLGANAGNAQLIGPTTVAAIGGVATFSRLRIWEVGNDFTLVAKVPGISVQSRAFSIVPENPSGLIAFARSDGNGSQQILIMNSDGTGLLQLTSDNALYWSPAWSPDGTKLAFARYTESGSQIVVAYPDGSGTEALTHGDEWVGWPAWSPDGSRIVYSRFIDNDDELWVMNADGSGKRALMSGVTGDGGTDIAPAWSPDGMSVAFLRAWESLGWNLYVVNSDGSNPRTVSRNQPYDWYDMGGPVWSPDGSSFLLWTRWGDPGFTLTTSLGTDPRKLAVDLPPVSFIGGSWSPGGTLIAFRGLSGPGGASSDIYIMDRSGSNVRRLTTDGRSGQPVWRPRPKP